MSNVNRPDLLIAVRKLERPVKVLFSILLQFQMSVYVTEGENGPGPFLRL